jgi:hypothetical protein
MAVRPAVGPFQSSGVALDAYHRLRTEGIEPRRLAHRVLKEVARSRHTLLSSSRCGRAIRWCGATCSARSRR